MVRWLALSAHSGKVFCIDSAAFYIFSLCVYRVESYRALLFCIQERLPHVIMQGILVLTIFLFTEEVTLHCENISHQRLQLASV